MRFCFIGVGSIAKRHIRNLKAVLNEEGIDCRIDVVRRTLSKQGLEGLDIAEILTSSDQMQHYDAVFITNPTELHLQTLDSVWGKADAYFIEKPVTSVERMLLPVSREVLESSICYVACPLRYKKVIQYLKEKLDLRQVNGIRAISSSYLPEWREGIDYRKTYSAKKALGGGVSIDLIHEWDYIRYLFGNPNRIAYYGGKKSNLEIDTEDTAIYLAEYDGMFAEIHLDYYGRKSLREIMIFTEQDTIRADLISNDIEFLKSGRKIHFEEARDDFQKEELRHFLGILRGNASDSTIREAIDTMQLTQGRVPEER